MPAVSKAQRKLFALALAVKRGEVDAADVDQKILDLSKKKEADLKDYAETPEETLPNKVEDNVDENSAMATPGSVNGMGAVRAPGDPGTQAEFSTQETGSGDLAATSALTHGNPDKDGKKAKKIYKFLKFNAFVGESLDNELYEYYSGIKKGDTLFFYPWPTIVDGNHEYYHLEPFGYHGDMNDRGYKDTTNNTMGKGAGKYYPEDIQKYIDKYGTPSKKELKVDGLLNDEFWKISKQVPREAYRKFDWKKFGQGRQSNMNYAYLGNNQYEFHLNLPRAIRHPEEYGWVTDEDIQMFDKIEDQVQKLADKVRKMGFKVDIYSKIDGFKK